MTNKIEDCPSFRIYDIILCFIFYSLGRYPPNCTTKMNNKKTWIIRNRLRLIQSSDETKPSKSAILEQNIPINHYCNLEKLKKKNNYLRMPSSKLIFSNNTSHTSSEFKWLQDCVTELQEHTTPCKETKESQQWEGEDILKEWGKNCFWG